MLRIELAALGAATALWRSAVLAREEAQLERFPLGLNRDSQGGRKGGVLGGDSAL